MHYDIPEAFKPFIRSVKRQCKLYKVELVLSPSKLVVLTDDFKEECAGYFEDTEKALVVACGRPIEEWMQLLVHEYCHMEQWKSDERWAEWMVACGKLWGWMAGETMLNKKQLSAVIDTMIELEKDCEVRAIDMIQKWKLPIDKEGYIQRANIYLYSYAVIDKLKMFPTNCYTDPLLLRYVPTTFMKSYRKLPKGFEEYMLTKYSKK
jgi:hypothetical protein